MHNAKQTAKHAAPWVLLLVLLAGLAAVRGLGANYDIGYEIMNGDFQNYNPVRHLLAGQAPYKDFTVYLGAGELYSVGGLLLILGNSFGRSMFATNFCTWFYFELLALAVCLVVLGSGRAARAGTAALCSYFFLVVQGVRVPLADSISPLLEYAASNGNSARMIRSAALTLAVLVILLGLRIWQGRGMPRCGPLPLPALLVPLTAGALVPWSNDMGGAMYISVALGYGLFLIREYRTNIRAIAVRVVQYIAVSVAGLGVSVTLISWGHPLAWLRQTRGTGSYQTWYYGTLLEEKTCSLSELRWPGAVVFCLVLTAGFAAAIFLCKSRRSAVLAAAGLALTLGMALWNVLYGVVSASNNGPAGGAAALVAVLIPAFAVRAVLTVLERLPSAQQALRAAGRWLPRLCALLCCAVLAVGMKNQIASRIGGHGEGRTYVPELGGWIGDQAQKLATEQQITAGRRVFGTYSSALEAMTGQLQPTGTDYIIHAMGDRQRLAYLQTFQAGDFDLVVTPSVKVAPFERWSRNANWWFYRELYRYWAPVGNTYVCGGMHLFWERTGVDNNHNQPAAVTVTPGGDGTVTLTVTTQDPAFCGVADVSLCYRLTDASSHTSPLERQFLHVTCVTENELCAAAGRETHQGDFYLPLDRDSYDIPITISDGTGTVVLTARSTSGTMVPVVEQATVNATYTDWEYFFE